MGTEETRIIGGMFGLELSARATMERPDQKPAFLAGPHLLLATSRSAFTLLARTLRPKTVWLPSYLCGVILGAFPTHFMRIRFYAVDERLRIADEAWLAELHPGDMVVFIDYFGFREWADKGVEARGRGAWLVEDAAQALLSGNFCEHSHYVVFSPRKFIGVPDGGVLLAQAGAELPEARLPAPPSPWWLESTRASILRAEFDRHGGKREWFDIFQKAELAGPLEPCRMSDLSTHILKHAVDWQAVARRRCRNYRFLLAELRDIALFPRLPAGVVPLGFPIRLKNRDRVRQALFDAQIYPPIHWAIADVVPTDFEASHGLAEEILTIPCDQRYDESDMQRVASELRRAVY